MKLNHIYCGDNVEVMKEFPEGGVDLTISSPPYDNMRNYKGFEFDYQKVVDQLWRLTKPGGVVVWIVGDATVLGDETGTSFKQALYFKEVGFKLHDTMIYAKKNVGASGSLHAYWQAFEYMFVFVKGELKTFNPIRDLIPKKLGQEVRYPKYKSTPDGYYKGEGVSKIAQPSKRTNVWFYTVGGSNKDDSTGHPAQFPEALVRDHIISWSNEGDIVLDPFLGSGTTAKVAKMLKRNYVGIDISPEYCEIANNRVNTTPEMLF